FARPAFDGESGNEPGRLDGARGEKVDDPARRERAEFAARERRRRRHSARDEAGLRIKIERQADDMAGHGIVTVQPRLQYWRRRGMIGRRAGGSGFWRSRTSGSSSMVQPGVLLRPSIWRTRCC